MVRYLGSVDLGVVGPFFGTHTEVRQRLALSLPTVLCAGYGPVELLCVPACGRIGGDGSHRLNLVEVENGE